MIEGVVDKYSFKCNVKYPRLGVTRTQRCISLFFMHLASLNTFRFS